MKRLLSLFLACLFSVSQSFAQLLPPAGFYPTITGSGDTTAEYLQLGSSAINSNYRIFTLGTGLTGTDMGAKNDYTITLAAPLQYLSGLGFTTQQGYVNSVLNFSGIATGDMVYFNGTNWVRLPLGSANTVLTSVGGVPTWSAAGAGAPANQTYLTTTNQVSNLPNSAVLTQGSGIALSSGTNTETVAVDSTVIRTTGAQSLAGPKTLSGGPVISGAQSSGLVLQGSSFADTLTVTDPSAARAINIPDPGVSSSNFVLDQGASTLVGQKTFTANPIFTSGAFDVVSSSNVITVPSVTDTMALLTATQTLSNKTEVSPTINTGITLHQTTANYSIAWNNPTAARTYTIPDAGGAANFQMESGAITAGGVAYGNGNLQLFTGVGSTGQPLISAGSGAPGFGTLGVAGGGTGITTYAAGDIPYCSTAGSLARLAAGTANQILQINSGTGLPNWVTATGSGGVTSVALSGDGVVYNTSVTGSPITSTGTLSPSLMIHAANQVLAAPNGTSGTPTFRSLVLGDMPSGIGTVTNVSMTGDGTIFNSTVSGSPITTSGTLAQSLISQAPLTVLGGSSLATGSSAAPTFSSYDRTAWMGGQGLRALPTSGALSGDYYNKGNWTQTGAITATSVRIYNSGTMTFNNNFVVATECGGGGGAASTGANVAGGRGSGFGGGGGGSPTITVAGLTGGAGGSFGGAGGTGGSSSSSVGALGVSGIYPISVSLSGSGGGGGCSSSASGTSGGNGGAGGGSLYIESTGAITFASGTNITANGGAGTSGTGGAAGAGGSGGGIQIRCLSTVTIASGASLNAIGGAGGSSTLGAGGGGGGGIIEISGSTVTNTAGLTPLTNCAGGAAGTGGSFATAGSAGLLIQNQFPNGPRSVGQLYEFKPRNKRMAA